MEFTLKPVPVLKSFEFPGQGGDPRDSPARPALALGSHPLEVSLVTVVDHLGVAARAEVGIVDEELLVPEVEEVTLRVVEGGEDLHVHHPVLLSQLLVKVRGSLTGEFAMEDENISLLLIVRVVLRCGRQRGLGDEGLEEGLVLAVLPVLGPVDVTSLVLEVVSHINDPEDEIFKLTNSEDGD